MSLSYRMCVFFLAWSHNREQRPLSSSCPSVHTYHLGSCWAAFRENLYLEIFLKIRRHTPDLKTALCSVIGLLRSE